MASREKRYIITMAIRTACFVSMIFVPGPFRWVLLAAAIFLPYVAVVAANQANTKTSFHPLEPGEPSSAPQLTAGEPPEEPISGELANAETDAREKFDSYRDPTGDTGGDGHDGDDHRWTRHDRVA